MLSLDDPFAPILEGALDYNYPPLKTEPDVPQAKVHNPVTFYDRHIASNLVLKCFKNAPSIPQDLSAIWDEMLEAFTEDGHHFDRTHYSVPRDIPATPHYSTSVGEQYFNCIALPCLRYASKLCIHPRDTTWSTFFGFSTFHVGYEESNLFLREGRMYPDYKSAESILTRMKAVSRFKWEGVHTLGYPDVSPLSPPLDAPKGLFVREMIPKFQRSQRVSTKASTSQLHHSASSTTPAVATRNTRNTRGQSKPRAVQVKVPGRRREIHRDYRPNANDFIQRAWASAVEYDATFIIFNCGTYERIGVRHRASQTLYLSDLIDTVHCNNPKYRKLHMGLYVAIVTDVLERYNAKKNASASQAAMSEPPRRKRSAEHLESATSSPSKRRKPNPLPRVYNQGGRYRASKIDKELSTRELALIKLNYGIFCSSAPSSFIRLGPSCVPGLFDDAFKEPDRRAVYTSKHFMTATLEAPIGSGAIGVVHKAMIEIETEAGNKLQHRCLIKLGFSEDQQRKMQHEYDVYLHLAAVKAVEGVVSVHGLFQDIETGTMAMVMNYGGKSLAVRESEKNKTVADDELDISEQESDAFQRALAGIHRAGVLHRDIRSDNLLISEDNEVSIIDFDLYDLKEILNHAEEDESDEEEDEDEEDVEHDEEEDKESSCNQAGT
ncbi:hypothetical protein BDZ97DRAFT_1837845 [Flammula alnicola]|nr:hypothetical protein BDZ97DRAFT_1837845 [Flammula alnicola]